ncbi:MAG: NHL repeat containing protein, partial [uncultured bacterium]
MKKSFSLALAAIVFPVVTLASFGDTTTYIGSLVYGDGGFRTDAYFDFPEDIIADGAGNFYVTDTFNGVIRKIDANGIVSTVVGQGGYGDVNGSATTSKFAHPSAVAVDDSGNVYIADAGNGKIKKFSGGRVTTLKSDLDRPEGLFIRNNKLYVTDYGTGKLYSMSLDGSNLQTITGSLNGPKKLYVRTTGDYAYITNAGNYTVVRVKLSGGSISVVAGTAGTAGKSNGSCSVSGFKNLWGLTVIEGASLDEDDIYVTDGTGDPGNNVDRDLQIQNTADAGKIRVIDINGSDVPVDDGSTDDDDDGGVIVTSEACETYLFAKDSETRPINYPNSITRYGDNLYVAVTGISEILRYTIGDATNMESFAGHDRFHNRNGKNGLPGRPKDLVITQDKKNIYYTENNKVKFISTSDRSIRALVGSTVDNYQRNDDKAWTGTDGRFSDALSLGLSKNEDKLYVVDRNNNRIREVDIQRKAVSYFTGAGEVNVGGGYDNGYQEGSACPNQFGLGRKNCAYFSRPGGIVVDGSGKYAYVADTGNEVIRRVTLTGSKQGQTKLIAGSPTESGFKDGTKTAAEFNVPIALTIDSADNYLYVADRDNHAIRKVRISDGKVTTVTGNPSTPGYLDGRLEDAYLNYPVEVYYNRGNIYFSESGTQRVRVVDMADDAVKLV